MYILNDILKRRNNLEMKFTKFVVIVLAACAVNIKEICCLRVDTMDTFQTQIDLKDPSWPFYSSGILKSHSGLRYAVNRNKTLILSAPKGYSIFAALRLFDLRPLNQDYLTLFANGTAGPVTYSNSLPYPNKKFDIFENKQTFYAPDGQLGVTFYTGPDSINWNYAGFELIYTVQANWTKCTSDNFHCLNGRCISYSFKCDEHNHCGDRSDQANCISPDPTPTGSGRIAGIIGGVTFLSCIFIGCVVYIMIRRIARTKIERRTVIIDELLHPSPTSDQDYPPPYTERESIYPPPPPPYSPYNQGIPNPGYHDLRTS